MGQSCLQLATLAVEYIRARLLGLCWFFKIQISKRIMLSLQNGSHKFKGHYYSAAYLKMASRFSVVAHLERTHELVVYIRRGLRTPLV